MGGRAAHTCSKARRGCRNAEDAMKFGRLNHIGVATPSIPAAVALYRDLLGAEKIGEAFDLPAQKVRVCFVDAPNSQIELLEPLGEDSPIATFLEKNPAGGQHHPCFEVADIAAAVAEIGRASWMERVCTY